MSAFEETSLSINGADFRVWTAGTGPKLGVLAGFGGLLQWSPFLVRLAKTRTVIVPSLPGFPGGGGRAHVDLDSVLDWLLLVREILNGCALTGEDLLGISLGAALAGDVTAVWPHKTKRLVLVSPLGICIDGNPMADPWGVTPQDLPALLCSNPQTLEAHQKMPEGGDDLEWEVSQIRANEAAARLLWPTGDTGLGKRIGRIFCDTLIVWGAEDKVVPPDYHPIYKNGPKGTVSERMIEGAGHQVDFDRPEQLANAINEFLG
jgi:pimeloyl-ACP methyl ester carboxylesterase